METGGGLPAVMEIENIPRLSRRIRIQMKAYL